ncbi:hypothetical protein E2562_031429 [Oryza meyeriana var. granulata]|uniref:Uncharacterized protein n=1 Tax=Oryza meyeriana var. granulata TaxID=110450 RepID=A0A6G1C1Z7_9ORYZ|nr:hypothetical protein E2562_031429 [Oryza meyeriana var. granulata]
MEDNRGREGGGKEACYISSPCIIIIDAAIASLGVASLGSHKCSAWLSCGNPLCTTAISFAEVLRSFSLPRTGTPPLLLWRIVATVTAHIGAREIGE